MVGTTDDSLRVISHPESSITGAVRAWLSKCVTGHQYIWITKFVLVRKSMRAIKRLKGVVGMAKCLRINKINIMYQNCNIFYQQAKDCGSIGAHK